MVDRLQDVAEDHDRAFTLESRGLGSKLSTYRNELAELYGLEIDDSRRTNRYRFNVDVDDGGTPTGLDRF